MVRIETILEAMRENPGGIRFKELARVCDEYFGRPRKARGGHRIYRVPWPGNPRVNIQNDQGMAKAYQVRQVLKAIGRVHADAD